MTLQDEFSSALSRSGSEVQELMPRLQKYASQQNHFEALWASGCQIKVLGIIDACSVIETLIPIAKSNTMDFENLVAMAKASYSYLNMHSLLHDILDNIGFMYGVKIMGRSEHAYAKSFLDIFNEKTGLLKTKSLDNSLNERFEKVYSLAKAFVDRDNDYKHIFAPGLIHLHQPESFIRNFPSITGNLATYLDKGAIKLDEAMNQITIVRTNLLPLVIELILQVGNYENN